MFFMKINKSKITAIFGILILSIFAGLLIRIYLKEPRLRSRQEETSTLKTAFKLPPVIRELEELNVPALPIPKPNLEVISKEKSLPNAVVPFFENINKAAKKVEESLMPKSAPAQNISTVAPDGIILSLTKDQFHFLYPDKFIASLVDAQNLFIKELDRGYEPILKIETDTQVRFIEEKIVTTLLSTGMITKEKAERFITTIRFTLPELQLIDLEKYNSYGFYKFLPPQTPSKKLLLMELMEKLADTLSPKAQSFVCGYCYSLPLCFQEGADTPGVPGSEVITPFCYCTGCLTALGCLSLFTGEAAIYDPVTGICGAGVFAD